MSLLPLLDLALRRHPQKTALFCRERAVTYGELDDAARGLARWFKARGLKPGDRVAIHWTNQFEPVALLLGCFRAGLIAVPLNTRFKPDEIGYVLGHARPRICFSHPELAPAARAAGAGTDAGTPVHTALPETAPGLDAPMPPEDARAVILYTSGTTARPKGVLHTHATLAASARTMWSIGIDSSSLLVVSVPLMHASGLMGCALPALAAGAALALIPVFDPAETLDTIERHGCTWGMGLPSMMQFLAVEQERRPRTISSLRTWAVGGDSVPASLQERFRRLFGFPLQEGYAMTESLIISCNPRDSIQQGSMGLPAAGVETRVMDREGKLLEDGMVGELHVSSPANFASYWDDPEATASALAEGWLRTGDLVRRDAKGYLWFEGRCKEVIVRGGSNISPAEVENILCLHPAVMESGVVGVPDPIYGERVVGFVSIRSGQAAGEGELRCFARERLADYKVPDRIGFLEDLPKGLTGKVQRRSLREAARALADGANP